MECFCFMLIRLLRVKALNTFYKTAVAVCDKPLIKKYTTDEYISFAFLLVTHLSLFLRLTLCIHVK